MSRPIRSGMFGVPALILTAMTAPCAAQVQPPPDAPEYYKACVDEATSRHSIILTADKTIYSCFGAAAENYYDFLVKNGALETVDKQRTGTYIFREIAKIGRCWTKIENVDGTETASHGCAINVAGHPK
jgi:hypothetical protein